MVKKSISERAIAVRQRTEVEIGGRQFNIKRNVVLPTLRQDNNAVYFTVLEPMHRGAVLKPRDGRPVQGAAMLLKVRDLETEREMVYVVPAVLQSRFEEEYDASRGEDHPDGAYQGSDDYVGRSFAVKKLPKEPTKRHRDLEVLELELADEAAE